MSQERYLALIRDARALAAVRRAIRFVAGADVDYDLRLVLAASDVPEPRLGSVALGQTGWLGRPGPGPKGRITWSAFSVQERAA